jgi:hypothetical protein
MSSSCKNSNLNKTIIIQAADNDVISACTGVFVTEIISCDGNTSMLFSTDYIVVEGGIIPDVDGTRDLGLPNRRFRDVNTISGTSTVWTSTQVVNTPNLNLGLDADGNQRNITADSSVIQDDILNGGNF